VLLRRISPLADNPPKPWRLRIKALRGLGAQEGIFMEAPRAFPMGLHDAKKEKPNFNIGSFSHRVNQNPYHDVIPQLRVRKVDPWPPMIWQGCFQSFIKRIIKMVWAIIDISNKGGLSGGFIPCRLR
jgi:hypothetical protein